VAHWVVVFDGACAGPLPRDPWLSAGIDPAARQLLHICRNSERSVRMNPGLIGWRERAGEQDGIGLVHSAGLEDRADGCLELARSHPPFILRAGIFSHRTLRSSLSNRASRPR